MVQYTYRFERVLTVREQEKQQAEMAYKEAVRNFEDIASRLYELLKQKEELIEYQNERLAEGATINEIHHLSTFLESIEKTIEDVQQKVIQARAKMQWHEQKLFERNMEVRKLEKMKERDFENFKEEMNRSEMKTLDEISSILYNMKEIR